MKQKQKVDKKWILTITSIAFTISLLLSLISELIIPNVFIIVSIILVLIFILLGIIFDIIGVAVSTSDDKSFHSMASQKVIGSKTAINFIKNKEKVSSFCHDVIGDICGVVSGSCGLSIDIKLSNILNINPVLTTILITSIISALTIGGKAIGKTYALTKNNQIVYKTAKIMNIFSKKTI